MRYNAIERRSGRIRRNDIMVGITTSKSDRRLLYPVLLACLAAGRKASPKEIDVVARRIAREMHGQALGRAGSGGDRIDRAARLALEGEACCRSLPAPSPASQGS